MKIKVDTAVEVFVNAFPLLDDTDFKTRETAVAYNAAGMDLVWNFQTPDGVVTQTAVTPTTSGNYDWTHVGDGMYKIEIPASGGASINNDTEGNGWFTGIATGVLPWASPVFEFVPANISDSLVKGTDLLQVDMTQIGGDAQSATDLKDFADAGYDPATNKVQGVVLTDTLTTYTGNTVQTGDAYARLGAPAGASVSADVAAIQSDTNDIQTRLPAALVGGRIDANVGAISEDATAADNLEAAFDGTGGVTMTLEQLAFNPTGNGDCIIFGGSGSGNGIGFTRVGAGDVFDTAVAAALQQEAADALTAYDPPTNAEMEARTIVSADYATAAALDTVDNFLDTEIAAIKAVTDKLDTALELDGSVYRYTTNALEQSPTGGSAPTAADIADAVWNEAQADHVAAGSFGEIATEIASVLVDTAEIGAAGAGLTALATQASVDTIDDFLDTEIAAILADTNELQTDWANGGRLDLILDARASQTSVDTVDGIVDAILVDTAEIGAAGAGLTALATQASVDTIDDFLDTEIAAIKAKTDGLTFTVANHVDVNIQYVNDIQVQGDGEVATPWNPV